MPILRFAVGESAVIAISASGSRGKIVEILAVGPFKEGDVVRTPDGELRTCTHEADYVATHVSPTPERPFALVRDYKLRKIDPPAEPASLTRRSEYGACRS
jgi:hypothetical protein